MTMDEKTEALMKLLDINKILDLLNEAKSNMSVTRYEDQTSLFLGFPVRISIEMDCRGEKG